MWPARFHPIDLVQHVLKFHPVYPSSNSTGGEVSSNWPWFDMCQGFIRLTRFSYLFEESSLSPVLVVVVPIPFGEDSAFESFLRGGFLQKEINAVGVRNEHLVLCFANQKGNLYYEKCIFFSLLKIRVCLCVCGVSV